MTEPVVLTEAQGDDYVEPAERSLRLARAENQRLEAEIARLREENQRLRATQGDLLTGQENYVLEIREKERENQRLRTAGCWHD